MITPYCIGSPYMPGSQGFAAGSLYSYANGAHEYAVFLPQVTGREIRAFRNVNNRVEFALRWEAPAIYLLTQVEKALPWNEGGYSIHLVPLHSRTLPGNDKQALIRYVLVDAASGLVQGVRHLKLSEEMTSALHSAIHDQAALPFDEGEYHAFCDRFERLNPSLNMVLNHRSITRCIGRDYNLTSASPGVQGSKERGTHQREGQRIDNIMCRQTISPPDGYFWHSLVTEARLSASEPDDILTLPKAISSYLEEALHRTTNEPCPCAEVRFQGAPLMLLHGLYGVNAGLDRVCVLKDPRTDVDTTMSVYLASEPHPADRVALEHLVGFSIGTQSYLPSEKDRDAMIDHLLTKRPGIVTALNGNLEVLGRDAMSLLAAIMHTWAQFVLARMGQRPVPNTSTMAFMPVTDFGGNPVFTSGKEVSSAVAGRELVAQQVGAPIAAVCRANVNDVQASLGKRLCPEIYEVLGDSLAEGNARIWKADGRFFFVDEEFCEEAVEVTDLEYDEECGMGSRLWDDDTDDLCLLS